MRNIKKKILFYRHEKLGEIIVSIKVNHALMFASSRQSSHVLRKSFTKGTHPLFWHMRTRAHTAILFLTNLIKK